MPRTATDWAWAVACFCTWAACVALPLVKGC